MRKIYNILTVFFASAILFCGAGCDTRKGGGEPKKERTWVRMTGGLPVRDAKTYISRGDTIVGPIDPNASGLPRKQLDVAIVTVNHTPAGDPGDDLPGYPQWTGHEAETTRGFFGSNAENEVILYKNQNGEEIPITEGMKITNGLIEYLNESGDYIQRVFYPETENEYYYVRVVYPYQGMDQLIQMPDGTGAAMVFSGLTGHEDILCSNIGWGTQLKPVIETGEYIDNPDYIAGDLEAPQQISILKFSHVFAQLRFWIVAESENAKLQYGSITDLVVRFQPDKVVMRMIDESTMWAEDAVAKDYKTDLFMREDGAAIALTGVPLVAGFTPPATVGTENTNYAGCVMVMPNYTYRIEANTSERKWIGADYDFEVDAEIGRILPGKVYDVVLNFMEAYKLKIEIQPAKAWWMDSEFD